MEQLDIADVFQRDNLRITVDRDVLHIEARLPSPEDARISKSRRTRLYATTGGNVSVGGYLIGLNCFKPLSGHL